VVLVTHERMPVGKEFHARRGPATVHRTLCHCDAGWFEVNYLWTVDIGKQLFPVFRKLSCWNMFWTRKRHTEGCMWQKLLPLQQHNNSFLDFDLIVTSDRHSKRLTDQHKVGVLLLLLPFNKVILWVFKLTDWFLNWLCISTYTSTEAVHRTL